ncbi:TetR/AcrR family transcriptional regulator [Sphingobacteriales bacterium UPWRP_1]|nr:TetR family transcriptional regulator [Sphingobacteriales bacterium TSM_CSS]PSJ75082.1 TetR/AcrR family transcriptional regulator [Sphingobacteriales bacterium UPWRP_1]
MNRKEQIREIAQTMFRERGYAATSMRDLATAVGIEAASLYNHIKSKEDLLKEICFDCADEFFEGIHKAKTAPMAPDAQLSLAIKEHIQVVANNLDGSAVFLHEWRFLTEPYLSEFKAKRKYYRLQFQQIIEKGISEGIFKPVDAKVYSLSILSALNWIYDWYKPEGELSPQALAAQFSYLILEGLNK